MPINFSCPKCGKQLRAESKHSGRQIRCPKCLGVIEVPPVSSSGTSSEKRATVVPHLPQAAPLPDPPPKTPGKPKQPLPPKQPSRVSAGSRPTASDEHSEQDSSQSTASGLYVSRTTLFSQSLFLILVVLVAYAVGHAIGGDRWPWQTFAASEIAESTTISTTGKVSFRTPTGETLPDGGAVVILFPAGEYPDEPIPTNGLRPEDAMPTEENIAMRAIRSLGGVYLRADEQGRFQIKAIPSGDYRVLILSGNLQRDPAREPSTDELLEIERFFRYASDFLGRQQYVWDIVPIQQGQPLAFHLSRDD